MKSVYSIDFVCMLQILMSVPWDMITVIQMQLVIILMEATPVSVILDSLEMGSVV